SAVIDSRSRSRRTKAKRGSGSGTSNPTRPAPTPAGFTTRRSSRRGTAPYTPATATTSAIKAQRKTPTAAPKPSRSSTPISTRSGCWRGTEGENRFPSPAGGEGTRALTPALSRSTGRGSNTNQRANGSVLHLARRQVLQDSGEVFLRE